jgi:hypothetical protein
VDFDPIECLEHQGYRLASIDLISPGSTSGDAFLLCPGGQQIDLFWRSEQSGPSVRWSPPQMIDSLGVITIEVTEQVEAEGDLGPVLKAALTLIGPILAAGIDLPR